LISQYDQYLNKLKIISSSGKLIMHHHKTKKSTHFKVLWALKCNYYC